MNKQVADLLELSQVTVKMHRGAAMRKMAAESLAELVVMAHLLDLHARADLRDPPPFNDTAPAMRSYISRSNISA